MENINTQNFEEKVLKSDLPTLVDFWAPWCGPCLMIAPVLEELDTEYSGKANIVKINIDEEQEIASKYNVQAIPNLILFKNGEVINNQQGLASKDALKKIIDSAL